MKTTNNDHRCAVCGAVYTDAEFATLPLPGSGKEWSSIVKCDLCDDEICQCDKADSFKAYRLQFRDCRSGCGNTLCREVEV